MESDNINWTVVCDHRTWEELYAEAVTLSGRCPDLSCIQLQRTLGIGYARASRLLTELKRRGDYINGPEIGCERE